VQYDIPNFIEERKIITYKKGDSIGNNEVNQKRNGTLPDGKVMKFMDGIMNLVNNMNKNGNLVFTGCYSGKSDPRERSFANNFSNLLFSTNKEINVFFPQGLTKFYNNVSDEFKNVGIIFNEILSYHSYSEWLKISSTATQIIPPITLNKRGNAISY
jgi:hypothetical protein